MLLIERNFRLLAQGFAVDDNKTNSHLPRWSEWSHRQWVALCGPLFEAE
ncbi:hypothetical protein [Paraburkholderia solisilvae]|nr:hypothetical protein [Paraburkholderia solisilvae]